MSRTKAKRRVAALPKVSMLSSADGTQTVMEPLTIDEYETYRLINYVGLTQSEAAAKMGVARTTVQAIYAKARVKLAQLLVDGGTMRIEGGDYVIAGDGDDS